MPGPVSDSYDCEWGTAAEGERIKAALKKEYNRVSRILQNKPPMYIFDVLDMPNGELFAAPLTQKEWRLIRFALERAIESI